MEVVMHRIIGPLSLAPALVVLHIIIVETIDPPNLPSIESITATADLRPFLAPGVPRELKLAALRRTWVMDPRIRDFRGLRENEWDFNDPSGIPGFGPLERSEDTKRFAAPVFAETDGKIDTSQSR
jgi:hypothetical protein